MLPELLERERAGERLLDQAIRQQAVETVSDRSLVLRNSDRQSVLKKMGWKKKQRRIILLFWMLLLIHL